MGDRYLGTFEAKGVDYQEVVRIYDSEGIKFEHSFYSGGVLVVKERGNIKIKNYTVEFLDDFTVCVDSESARPLPSPTRFGGYSMILLREGDPETDRLLPFPEHRYHLTKKQNKSKRRRRGRRLIRFELVPGVPFL